MSQDKSGGVGGGGAAGGGGAGHSQTKADRDDSVCIGSLEHHLHQVFASIRVPGEDFVYSPSTELYNWLDDFCNDETMHLPQLPLILTGASGTGKSALLSNWLLRRQRMAARSRVHGHTADEFVFWHAVGCTRQSTNVNSLLRRLMLDLRQRFDLAREVPIAQERLSWELPRFLEMAAKRGRLLIVIDGLHRLLTNDDAEASLAWLPLDFPPNVRVILTVTERAVPAAGPGGGAGTAAGGSSVSMASSSVVSGASGQPSLAFSSIGHGQGQGQGQGQGGSPFQSRRNSAEGGDGGEDGDGEKQGGQVRVYVCVCACVCMCVYMCLRLCGMGGEG